MSDQNEGMTAEVAAKMLQEMGLANFLEQMGHLQKSLAQVADGMDALGQNAVRQSQDTDNLAAHILAMESVLTVVLRQIPVDMANIRAEVERRTKNLGADAAGGPDVVQKLAEEIVNAAAS